MILSISPVILTILLGLSIMLLSRERHVFPCATDERSVVRHLWKASLHLSHIRCTWGVGLCFIFESFWGNRLPH